MKKGVFENFPKFTGKHLCQSLFFNKLAGSLFLEEISAWAAVHTRYVMNACDRVRSIILLPRMLGCHSCFSH